VPPKVPTTAIQDSLGGKKGISVEGRWGALAGEQNRGQESFSTEKTRGFLQKGIENGVRGGGDSEQDEMKDGPYWGGKDCGGVSKNVT